MSHAAWAALPWVGVGFGLFFAMSLVGRLLPQPVVDALFPLWIALAIPAYIAVFGLPYVFLRELISPGGIRSRTAGAAIGFAAGVVAINLVVGPPGPPLWYVGVSGVLFSILGMTEMVGDSPQTSPAG